MIDSVVKVRKFVQMFVRVVDRFLNRKVFDVKFRDCKFYTIVVNYDLSLNTVSRNNVYTL